MPKPNDPKQEPATLHDLELWGGQLALNIEEVRQEMKEMRQGFQENTRTIVREELGHGIREIIQEENNKMLKRLEDKMEVLVENRADEVLHAKAEEISLLKNVQESHEERITALETRP